MKFRVRETGEVITRPELLAMYPLTTFPMDLKPEHLEGFDVDIVLDVPIPIDERFFTLVEGEPKKVKGNWTVKYTMEEVSIEQARQVRLTEVQHHIDFVKADSVEVDDIVFVNCHEGYSLTSVYSSHVLLDMDTYDYHAVSGWVTFDMPTLKSCIDALVKRDKQLTTIKKSLCEEIMAIETVKELSTFDVIARFDKLAK